MLRERFVIAFDDVFCVDVLHADATFHGGHGREQEYEFLLHTLRACQAGAGQRFVATERGEHTYGAQICIAVVL